ncbi:MAG: arylsulfatase A-like enzyme [Halioglobus sp.]|jgi:arylsulfatase A-like enzyme
MASSNSSILDDKYSLGILLIVLLFFSWLLSIKNLVLDWTETASDSPTHIAPNILLIVVDDLGYDDTSAINENGLPTPNIQQLAKDGTTFRRHYADSTCTPSRVAMLTGRYPERSGFRPVGIEIPAEFPTIAQQLEAAGYATYLTGKWHAGEDRPQSGPSHKGFKEWFGFLNQWELSGEVTEANKGGSKKPTYHNPMLRKNGGELIQHSGHLTDILTDHTIAKISELSSSTKPWFIYHAFLAPHHPIQPAERYKAKFPSTPEGEYTALVTQMDDAVGRLLKAVDRENTLVVFVSDNGGTNKQRDNNFPFYGKKGDMYEGSYRTPLILNWPGRIPQGKFIDEIVMNVDIYPTLMATALVSPPDDLDGENLWPLLQGDISMPQRRRSWEIFNPNITALGYSFLSGSGDWRLASSQGLPPNLYDLRNEPAGKNDIADQHPEKVVELAASFWQEYWNKSLLHPSEDVGSTPDQTRYSGFDTLRTPFRYGFTIGLEIGPILETDVAKPLTSPLILAGQAGFWELRLVEGEGLEWEIGNTILRDASFEPSVCNAIILTGYLQPRAHLAKRDPVSQVNLYSSGFIRDYNREFDFSSLPGDQLHQPTYVNFNGRAKFSNMMLNSYGESYIPRISEDFVEIYTTLHKEEKLSLADVKLMDSELCRPGL